MQDKAAVDDWFGRVEDFVLTGTEEYRGTHCHVLECRPEPYIVVHRWYVGPDGEVAGHSMQADEALRTARNTLLTS